jgi:DUF2934 family protein
VLYKLIATKMAYFAGRTHCGRTRSGLALNRMPEDAPSPPRREEIASLAYSYWEARGRQGGSALEDWLRAERELNRRRDAWRVVS